MKNWNAAQTASAVLASAPARLLPTAAATEGFAARAPQAIRLRSVVDASVSQGRSRTAVR